MAKFLDLIRSMLGMAKEAVNTEVSLFDLQMLLDQGYTTTRWIASFDPCEICQAMAGQEWNLREVIDSTQYFAPLFCRSHPNCRCEFEVTGPGLPPVRVNWQGIIQQ